MATMSVPFQDLPRRARADEAQAKSAEQRTDAQKSGNPKPWRDEDLGYEEDEAGSH
jgi:hypothetical protein